MTDARVPFWPGLFHCGGHCCSTRVRRRIVGRNAIWLFRISVKCMLGGRGDVLDDLPYWRYGILGNLINQAKRSSQVLNLQFEFCDLLLRTASECSIAIDPAVLGRLLDLVVIAVVRDQRIVSLFVVPYQQGLSVRCMRAAKALQYRHRRRG